MLGSILTIHSSRNHAIVESLQSHCIHTHFHLSSGPPICFLSWGARVQSPGGVLMWNWDSLVSVVSLHWWSQPDWSLWPCLRGALSQTITRLSCRQCTNPTWSHTAFLSQFHTRCRSSFQLHYQHSWLPEGALWRALNLTAFTHSSTGPVVPCLLPVMRDMGSIPRGYLREAGILLLALSATL